MLTRTVVTTALVTAAIFLSVGSFKNEAAAFGTKETAYSRVTATKTLRCGYAAWPPFLQKDPKTGALSGFNVEIIEAMGRELDLKVEWVEEVGFGNYIEGLKAGRYDAMCQTVWPDAGRLKNALVTIPVHYHKVNVVARADDKRFNEGWKKLNAAEFKVSVIDGDITDSIAKMDFAKAQEVSLPQSADASQLFMEIETGKADATFVDYGFFQDYNRSNPGKLKIVGGVLRVYGSVFSVANDEVQLKAMMDNTIIALTNSGRIAEILKHYPTTAMAPAPTYISSNAR